jgi:hypothetical protein
LFAALGSIHAALDQQRLSSLYKQPVAPPALVPPQDRTQSALVAIDPFSAGRTSAAQVRIPSQDPPAGSPAALAAATRDATPPASTADSGEMASGEQAVLAKLRRRAGEGAEVVCIIRDRNNPQSTNEVITLDRASPAFVDQLSRAGQPQSAPHKTSLEVPKRPTPILEWDAETGWKHQGQLP